VLPNADHRIKLQVFEGPLDLLLFLIRKNEIDIYDIPIESVTKQYVAVLRSMQELDLELAGEFFVMAASLMEIKSRMLLPKGQHAVDPDGDGQDDIDPRWELVHQLLQYKRFKDAAAHLCEMERLQSDLMERIVSSRAESLERPLIARMQTERSFVFSALFGEGVSLRRLVATFLAVLELTRLAKMRLRQSDAFTDILCEAAGENPLETPADEATLEP
jgi:segregation and condensation protein A